MPGTAKKIERKKNGSKIGKTFDRPNNNQNSKVVSTSIKIGIFMDGTCNNSYNVKAREDYEAEYKNDPAKAYEKYGKPESKAESSYNNDHTNVNLLYKSYLNKPGAIEKIYMEGSGTVYDSEEPVEFDRYDNDDAMDGTGFGYGVNGIRGKVYKTLVDVVKYCNEDTRAITFDLFGFSRGASSARNIIYEMFLNQGIDIRTSPQYVYNQNNIDEFKVNKINTYDKSPPPSKDPYSYIPDYAPPLHLERKNNERIVFERTTNYQTPSKYVFKGGFLGYLLGRKNLDINDIQIRIRFVGILDTVASHATARLMSYQFDEGATRLFLNSFVSKAQQVVHLTAQDEHRKYFSLTPVTKSPKVFEYCLPGVHSDVGGGYVHNKIEKKCVGRNNFDKRTKWLLNNCYGSKDDFSSKSGNLIFERKKTAHYSRIPLKIITDLGDQFVQKNGLVMFNPREISKLTKLDVSSTPYLDKVRVSIKEEFKVMLAKHKASPENLKEEIKEINKTARTNNDNNKEQIITKSPGNSNDPNAISNDKIRTQYPQIVIPRSKFWSYEGIEVDNIDKIVPYLIGKYYHNCIYREVEKPKGYIDEAILFARNHIEKCISNNKNPNMNLKNTISVAATLQKENGLDTITDFMMLELVSRLIRCRCIHWSSDKGAIDLTPHSPVPLINDEANGNRKIFEDNNVY